MRYVACALLLGSVLSVVAASPAHAESLSFGVFGDAVSEDLTGQLSLDVAAVSTDRVSFTFTNNVGTASSITDVYFASALDDYLDFSDAVVTESSGVSFSEGASPPSVPSGSPWNWVDGAGFAADSNTPNVPSNGVDATGEWVMVTFDLQSGESLTSVLSFMGGSSAPTGWGVGMHVQAIGATDTFDGDSGWYGVVPEPASIALLGLGFVGLAGIHRRRRKS